LNVNRRILVVLGLTPLVCLLCGMILWAGAVYLAPPPQEYMEVERGLDEARQARESLRVGMTRAETRPILAKAWVTYSCYAGKSELYLFGIHDPQRAGIVTLQFDREGEGAVVTQVGDVEDYQIHLYEECASYGK
jgi:hypothetical protein